ASLLLVYVLFFTIGARRHLSWLVLGAVAGAAVLAVASLYLEHSPFEEILLQWGGGRNSQLSERAILTQQGLGVADKSFPLVAARAKSSVGYRATSSSAPAHHVPADLSYAFRPHLPPAPTDLRLQ